MAEGQDLVAVDIRHGPDGGHVQVAGDELQGDRIPFTQGQIRGQRLVGGLLRSGRRWLEAQRAEDAAGGLHRPVRESGKKKRHPQRRQRDSLPCEGRPRLRGRAPGGQHVIHGHGGTERSGRHRLAARLGRLGGDGQHLADRRDPGDRLLGIGESVGNGPQDLAVDIDGAAAHAGDDAAPDQGRMAGQPGDDDGALGIGIGDDAQDLDVELLDRAAEEDRAGLALQPGLDLAEGIDGRGGPGEGGGEQESECGGTGPADESNHEYPS